MGVHRWGDKDFDWASLNKAIDLMGNIMRRYGRIGIYSKEKYGTARIYTYFYYGGLFSLLYPGYMHYGPWMNKPRIGKYLMWMEYNLFQPITQYTGIVKLIKWYQLKIYNHAYQKALKLYSNIAEEIVEDADHPKLIKNWDKIMLEARFKNNDLISDKYYSILDIVHESLKLIPEGPEKEKFKEKLDKV